MILREVRNYLREKGSAELPAIMAAVKSDRNMTENILEILTAKGDVKKEISKPPCRSCTCGGGCISETVIYRYSGK